MTMEAGRTGRMLRKAIGFAAVAGVLLIGAVLALAPYVFAEIAGRIEPHAIIMPAPAVLARGTMVDDYWAVERLNAGTIAIGEPRYYQQNYSYLVLGTKRALLFDAGSGTRDILPVVKGLTSLPVTVVPSHLHYDHVGGITRFNDIALIDLPATRADVRDGAVTPTRYEFVGLIDQLDPPRFRVSHWIRPGSWIDLGGRRLQVLHTPGHTPTSAALFDPGQAQFFAGDFIYPGPLYAQLPGASRSAYRSTTDALLASLPRDTTIWSAHCCRPGEGIRAPRLDVGDLAALRTALDRFSAGQLPAHGFYPRKFTVNGRMEFFTGFAWNNQ